MKKLSLIFIGIFMLHFLNAQEHGIINNGENKYVKLKSIDLGDCHWTNGFWADKFKVCEQTMLPYMGEVLCGDVGHGLNNFKIAAGLKTGKHQGFEIGRAHV